MTQQDAFKLTREICVKYDINLSSIGVRNKKGAWGTAYTKKNAIIYSTLLFKQDKFKIMETICHEVAHLLAAKRHGRNCQHDRQFQRCETEIDEIYGFRGVYARSRGYAVAYLNVVTGEVLDCKKGYKAENGRVVVDYDAKINEKILRKLMKSAFAAKVFIKNNIYKLMTCEPIEGRLALTENGCDDRMPNSRVIIYQSELKVSNLRMKLKDVKYNGKSLSYNIE